jgi:methionine-rich copper-binding protein CopC
VISTKPTNGETGVNVSTNIEVTFSEAMNHPSAETSLSISPNVAGAFSWNGNAMTFDPLSDLADSVKYDVTVSTIASDISGNKLASDYKFSFTTGKTDMTPPTIKSTSPKDGATGVTVSTDVNIEFSELVDAKSAESAFSISPSVPGKITWSGASMIFVHSYDQLKFNTEYTVSIANTVTDLAGNKMKDAYQFKFKTVESAPEVTGTTPRHKETGVKLDASISMTFSRPMSTDSVEGSFSISPNTNGGTFTWSNGDQTVNYKPNKKFEPGTQYVIQLQSTAQDKGGVNLQDWFTFSFTTGSGSGTGPPTSVTMDMLSMLLIIVGVVVAIVAILLIVRGRRRKQQQYPAYQSYPPQHGYGDQSQYQGGGEQPWQNG